MRSVSPDLDQICVHFATFREQPAEERAHLSTELAGIAGAERVLVDTCHRVELVSVHDDGHSHGEVPIVCGRAAVRRVFEVVAGFDSAVLAEEQLLGQVRAAYEAALADGTTGPILNEVFRRALRFGRRVRTHARPGSDRSLADRGVAWLDQRIFGLGRVAVAGTGEMGRLVAARLAASGHPITVVSRSAERGRSLVEALPGTGHRLEVGALGGEALRGVEAVVLAVRSRAPLLTAELLGPGARPWVLDLSSPSGVERGVEQMFGERLLNIDALGAVPGAAPVIEPAIERRLRAELEAEVDRFADWLDGRRGADAVTLLHREADAVRRRHLERLRNGARFNPDQLAAVDASSAAMLAELLHRPTVEIKRAGIDAKLVRRLFGIEA